MPASGDFRREISRGVPARIRGRLVALDVVDSTNLYAREHRDAIPDDAVIVADEQRAGRGRLDRSWYSERGSSLLVTIVKELPPARLRTLMPLAVAVACASAIESVTTNLVVQLKWPNDLLVKGQKVGGILIGSVSSSRGAIGIGINVGEMALPAHLDGQATSLAAASGEQISRMELLTAIVDALEAVDPEMRALHTPLGASGAPSVTKSFSDRMVGLGTVVSFQETKARQPVVGMLAGLREDGALTIRTSDGIRHYHTGDLTTHLDQST